MLIQGKKATAGPLAAGLLVLLAFLLVLRSFFFEIFWVPSASMEPTVLSRELVLVSKIPRVFSGVDSFERGDLVVFRSVENPQVYILKRLVGLPGDRMLVDPENGLVINGAVVSEKLKSTLVEKWQNQSVPMNWTLPATSWEIEVPVGHFVALGDNRDHSVDSRVWGPVPLESLIGHVRRVLWSCKEKEGSNVLGCGIHHLRKWRLGVRPGGQQ